MSDLRSFPWPAIPGENGLPVWTGDGFDVGSGRRRILEYHRATGNWSHDLTLLHERQAGSSHPLDVASRRLTLQMIRRHCRGDSPVVLDVGSSSGYLVDEFKRSMPGARLVCSDYLALPLERLVTEHPDVPLLQFDVGRCPLPSECVDVVTAINVLEHIEDDRRAVGQIARILKPGGLAYFEVPTHPALMGPYDEYLLHFRRYRARDLLRMCAAAGFEIVEVKHLGSLLLAPFAVAKLADRLRSLPPEAMGRRVETQIRSTRRNPVVKWCLDLERALGPWIPCPSGIRCAVALRKPA